jgi:ATP-dependent 26S proteasome regulatory subunit
MFYFMTKKDIVKTVEQLLKSNPNIDANKYLRVLGGTTTTQFFPVKFDLAASDDFNVQGIATVVETSNAQLLGEAQATIRELMETLERIKKEPLLLQQVDRVSKDEKHCFIKQNEKQMRIEGIKELRAGDEVLLHPKTFQIVEHLGRPPLEISRFVPDAVAQVAWDDIGGNDEAKEVLREAIEFPSLYKELFKAYGKKQIKGILLSGPPGCGKTMLGRACATAMSAVHKKKASRTGFLYVKGPEILNCYVGNSEQTIRDLFFDAKRHQEEFKYPAIIFIDEADAILATRGSRNVGIGNTIVPAFLTEMDGLEESGAIVIIATNRPDVLDPAIVRDGRIDRKVVVARPTQEEGALILAKNLMKIPVQFDMLKMAKEVTEVIWSSDCRVTKDILLRDIISGAMLANIVQIATSLAMRRDMDKEPGGLVLDDLITAVNIVQKQCHGIRHALESELN